MQTVVGMYRTVDEANRVKQALLNEGYNGGDVTVIDQSESGYGAGTNRTASDSNTSNDTSVGSKIKHFFSNLTGGDEDTHRAYTEGINNGGALVAVHASEGEVDRASRVLQEHGAVDVHDASGAGYDTTGRGERGNYDANANRSAVAGEQVIPVVEEELVVGKRQVQRGGVRVFSRVVSQPVSESVNLHDERVIVDRRPVNRPATDADFSDAGPIEVRAMGEEAVVGKAGRVVEEVVVGKTAADRTETVQDSVRRTEVDVEEVDTDATAERTGATTGSRTTNRY